MQLPKYNVGGSAPKVEDGLTLLRFDDLQLKDHPDWAGTDKFAHADDGKRFHFMFTKLDEDRAVEYDNNNDPIEIDILTRTATGEKSNFFGVMSHILTPAELVIFQSGEDTDWSYLTGRVVHGNITHNEKGWPQIEAIVGIAKEKKTAVAK